MLVPRALESLGLHNCLHRRTLTSTKPVLSGIKSTQQQQCSSRHRGCQMQAVDLQRSHSVPGTQTSIFQSQEQQTLRFQGADKAVRCAESRSGSDMTNQFQLPSFLLAMAPATAVGLLLLLANSEPALASPMNTFTIPGIVGDDPFREGVVQGFLLILFSELGDKTFFIALLLALRSSKVNVFIGTFGALAVMTVISVALGQVLHQVDELLPQSAGPKIPFDDLFAAALLIFFGIKTLQDAATADATAAEEKEEAQEVVSGLGADKSLILSTFALVFAAEWGDKSFLATIALAAASSPAGVVAGAVTGHGVATGIAVAGGSVLSKYVDERVLQYVGGSLFLVFAASTLLDIWVEMKPVLAGA